jgi:hypothetical protein
MLMTRTLILMLIKTMMLILMHPMTNYHRGAKGSPSAAMPPEKALGPRR